MEGQSAEREEERDRGKHANQRMVINELAMNRDNNDARERRWGCDQTSERKSGLLLLNCGSGLVPLAAAPLAYPAARGDSFWLPLPPSRFGVPGVPGALSRCTGGVAPRELYGDSCRPRLAAIEPFDG